MAGIWWYILLCPLRIAKLWWHYCLSNVSALSVGRGLWTSINYWDWWSVGDSLWVHERIYVANSEADRGQWKASEVGSWKLNADAGWIVRHWNGRPLLGGCKYIHRTWAVKLLQAKAFLGKKISLAPQKRVLYLRKDPYYPILIILLTHILFRYLYILEIKIYTS